MITKIVIVQKNVLMIRLKSLMLLMILFMSISADEIFLTNGDKAKTEIVDTSGCEVKILRNGNSVIIKKKLIQKIIWNTDTIAFTDNVCSEKPRKVIRYEDTPEYQLMALVDNSKKSNRTIMEKSRILFLSLPLQGKYNADDYKEIETSLTELFNKKALVTVRSPAEVLSEINSEQHQFDYIFMVRKYHNEIYRKESSGFAALGSGSQGEKKMELFTMVECVLFDIQQKEIVFYKNFFEKRSVWGENDNSLIGLLLPDTLQRKGEMDQANRKLDRNSEVICKKMKNDVAEYLGLTK